MMREIERKKLGLKTTTNKICWNMLYISYLHVEWKPKICNGCNVRSGLLLSCFLFYLKSVILLFILTLSDFIDKS